MFYEENALACNSRHLAANKFNTFRNNKDASSIQTKDYHNIERVFIKNENNWLNTRCCEFSCWWENNLFESLFWISESDNAKELLELLVKEWLRISLDMVCQSNAYCEIFDTPDLIASKEIVDSIHNYVSKHCVKSKTIKIDDWERERLIGTITGSTNLKKYILVNIPWKLEVANASPNVYKSIFNCLTQKALSGEFNSLLKQFYGVAVAFSTRYPKVARYFLNDVIKVTEKCPYECINLFSDFIRPIAKAEILKESEKKEISNKIEKWIDDEDDPGKKAQIRDCQDGFMFLIWCHKPRPKRKAGNKHTTAQICLPREVGTHRHIDAIIADVSDGYKDKIGLGIRLRISDWKLITDDTESKKNITIKASKDGNDINLREPNIIIDFNGETLEGTATILRCFDYSKYNSTDFGIVFELPSDRFDPEKLKRWQDFVLTELDPVDYGYTGILR